MLAKINKNTRFYDFFLANKILALILKFPRVQNTRKLIAFLLLYVQLSHSRAKLAKITQLLTEIFKEYSGGFARNFDIYSQGFLLAHFESLTKCSLFPRFFSTFPRFAFSRTFFSSLFFPRMRGKNGYAREKKRTYETPNLLVMLTSIMRAPLPKTQVSSKQQLQLQQQTRQKMTVLKKG